MPLIDHWKANQKEFLEKHLQQVIAFAGDGKLRDGGIASQELRDLLALLPPEHLSRYAEDCLKDKFDNGGLALQDVINEVGKRLGFKVAHGRYRGVAGEIGFDGLWNSPDGHSIVVEVKTTDAYRIDLNTVANYRRNLISKLGITEATCSILIIVGRNDTGDLEAQVRGSRHAWDIRLISIDALMKLMRVKVKLEDPQTMDRIRRVLMPQEFTRVDGIIDLVFSTAEEVELEEAVSEEDEEQDDTNKVKISRNTRLTPLNFRDGCAARVQRRLGIPLVKLSFATYSSADEQIAVVCINSREYKKANHSGFWFSLHPHQRDFLQERDKGYLSLGCGSEESILLIPAKDFLGWLDRLNMTEQADRSYWHIRITKDNTGYLLLAKKGSKPVKLDQYLLPPPTLVLD